MAEDVARTIPQGRSECRPRDGGGAREPCEISHDNGYHSDCILFHLRKEDDVAGRGISLGSGWVEGTGGCTRGRGSSRERICSGSAVRRGDCGGGEGTCGGEGNTRIRRIQAKAVERTGSRQEEGGPLVHGPTNRACHGQGRSGGLVIRVGHNCTPDTCGEGQGADPGARPADGQGGDTNKDAGKTGGGQEDVRWPEAAVQEASSGE